MEIDIKENRAKTAGKTEVERMIDRAKIDKEPPFSPELEKALLGMDPQVPKDKKEFHEKIKEPARLLREAVQYYSNLLVPPKEPKSPLEMAIVTIAAGVVHETLENLITTGKLGGKGTFYFYKSCRELSKTFAAAGILSKDGKNASARFGYDPTGIAGMLEGFKDIDCSACDAERGEDLTELIKTKSKDLFNLIREVCGDGVTDMQARSALIEKVARNDPKAQELLGEFGAIEDAWLKQTRLEKLTSSSGALMILVILLESFVRRLRAELGSEGFEFFELIHLIETECEMTSIDGGMKGAKT